MLLDQGAHYNALQVAYLKGHGEVAQILPDRSAYLTTLAWCEGLLAACMFDDEKSVETLLNLDQQHWNEHIQVAIDTALQAASFKCHENIVRLLLKKGANVNARSGSFGNALYAASLTREDLVLDAAQFSMWEAMESIAIEPLTTGNALEASLLITVLNGKDRTRQSFNKVSADLLEIVIENASISRHEFLGLSPADPAKVVKILLDNDVDVNAQDGKFGNPLQAASYIGNEKVVRMLLNKGADANAEGGWYGNAPNAALARGHKGVEQTLREYAKIDGRVALS